MRCRIGGRRLRLELFAARLAAARPSPAGATSAAPPGAAAGAAPPGPAGAAGREPSARSTPEGCARRRPVGGVRSTRKRAGTRPAQRASASRSHARRPARPPTRSQTASRAPGASRARRTRAAGATEPGPRGTGTRGSWTGHRPAAPDGGPSTRHRRAALASVAGTATRAGAVGPGPTRPSGAVAMPGSGPLAPVPGAARATSSTGAAHGRRDRLTGQRGHGPRKPGGGGMGLPVMGDSAPRFWGPAAAPGPGAGGGPRFLAGTGRAPRRRRRGY